MLQRCSGLILTRGAGFRPGPAGYRTLVTTFVVRAVATSSRPAPLRALCVVMLVLLAAWWVRGYRCHTFPVWSVPLEMVTFVVLVLVQDVVISVVTLAYFSVQLRSLYDGWPRTVLFGTSTALTFAAATRAVPVGGWTEGPPLPATTFASIPLIMVVIHLVALAGQQTERGAARERLLSRTALASVRAGDAEAARGVALAAVRELLADDGEHTVALHRAGGHAASRPDACVVDLPVPVAGAHDGVLRITGLRPPGQEVGTALLVVATHLSSALTNAVLHADLAHRADHDPLTGLGDRLARSRC